jgi:hypothetical protein
MAPPLLICSDIISKLRIHDRINKNTSDSISDIRYNKATKITQINQLEVDCVRLYSTQSGSVHISQHKPFMYLL